MSNSFLRDVEGGLIGSENRQNAVELIIDHYNLIEPNKSKFPEYFEFINLIKCRNKNKR